MDGEARVAHGFYVILRGRLPEGAAELRRAVELAPMNAQVLRLASSNMPYWESWRSVCAWPTGPFGWTHISRRETRMV
jgi:hypothetical protein